MSKEVFLNLKPFRAEFCIFQLNFFFFLCEPTRQDNHLNQNADFSRLAFQNFLKIFHHVGHRALKSTTNYILCRSVPVNSQLFDTKKPFSVRLDLTLVTSLDGAPPTAARRIHWEDSSGVPGQKGWRQQLWAASHPASRRCFSAVLY